MQLGLNGIPVRWRSIMMINPFTLSENAGYGMGVAVNVRVSIFKRKLSDFFLSSPPIFVPHQL
jgi:hypothetical protein